MAYELIIGSAFLYFYYCNTTRPNNNIKRKLHFKEGKALIVLLALLSIAIILMLPSIKNSLSFLIISSSGNRISSLATNESLIIKLASLIFRVGLYCMYLLLINKLYMKYELSHKHSYVYIVLIITMMVTAVIFNEQREFQVYFAFASIYVLLIYFPEYKKIIITTVIMGVGVVLVFMSLYKHLYVFVFDSYLDALGNNSINANTIIASLDAYLLGPNQVSAAIDLSLVSNDFSITRLLYDVFRPIVGIGGIIESDSIKTTSELYNLYVSRGCISSGYLLPITAQGYIHFGFIFSPIFLIVVLRVALCMEKILRTSSSLVNVFFMGYLFIRYATCVVASNTSTIITQTSLILFSVGLIQLIQWCIKRLTHNK